jgi:RND family efflux transporter MFP subunit
MQTGNPTRFKFGGALAVALAVAGAVALTLVLHLRASDGDGGAERTPMPVTTRVFTVESGYLRNVSYLGLVKAGRKTVMAFEVPGAVADLKVNEGSRVVAGDVLASLDTAQLGATRAAAEAELAGVRAQLELAGLRTGRQAGLSATGAISQQVYDETRLTEKALSAQLNAVQARLGGIDIDLAKSVLRAPYDAVVAQRRVNLGAVVNAGSPVLELVASGQREAHIGIAVEKAGQLAPGETYALTFRGAVLRAGLRSVRPDVDPRTLTTTAVFVLPEGTPALDGEPIALNLSEPVAMNGGWLPISALLEGERGVWTVLRLAQHEGATVTAREAVEVLEIQGDRAYVRGTLTDQQSVVIEGLHRIAPGTAVRALES